jgi:hypothetical protein
MAVHWIDAGVLIHAVRGPYPHNRVPQFWSFLHEQLEAGTVRMPRMAYEEVVESGYTDELRDWCKNRKQLGLCVVETKLVQERYGLLAAHAQGKYKPHQVAQFLAGADGWIIASAMATDGVVVAQENERHNRSKIKIPTVAKAFDVKVVNMFQMLNALHADFS